MCNVSHKTSLTMGVSEMRIIMLQIKFYERQKFLDDLGVVFHPGMPTYGMWTSGLILPGARPEFIVFNLIFNIQFSASTTRLHVTFVLFKLDIHGTLLVRTFIPGRLCCPFPVNYHYAITCFMQNSIIDLYESMSIHVYSSTSSIYIYRCT